MGQTKSQTRSLRDASPAQGRVRGAAKSAQGREMGFGLCPPSCSVLSLAMLGSEKGKGSHPEGPMKGKARPKGRKLFTWCLFSQSLWTLVERCFASAGAEPSPHPYPQYSALPRFTDVPVPLGEVA